MDDINTNLSPDQQINPVIDSVVTTPTHSVNRTKYLIIFLICLALVLAGAIIVLAKNKNSSTPVASFTSSNETSIPTSNPSPIITVLPTITSIPSSKPIPTNTIKPTQASTTGKLSVTFQPLYTQESIKDFEVTISKDTQYTPLVKKTTGNGKTFSQDNLAPGRYLLSARTGSSSQYCGISGESSKTSPVAFEIIAGKTTDLNLNIYPYPGVIFLKTKNYFPIANAQVSTGFYTATTDQLGRAVLYNINPGPYNLEITTNGQKFNQTVTDNRCLWLQQIISPLDTVTSTVSVTINPTVSYTSLQPELLIKDIPLDIKPNSLGNWLPSDDARKYYLTPSNCRGSDSGSYFRFGSAVSLYASGQTPEGPQTNNTVQIQVVDSGNYQVCVFNSSNPDSSYSSSVSNISVSGGVPVQTTINYPKLD